MLFGSILLPRPYFIPFLGNLRIHGTRHFPSKSEGILDSFHVAKHFQTCSEWHEVSMNRTVATCIWLVVIADWHFFKTDLHRVVSSADCACDKLCQEVDIPALWFMAMQDLGNILKQIWPVAFYDTDIYVQTRWLSMSTGLEIQSAPEVDHHPRYRGPTKATQSMPHDGKGKVETIQNASGHQRNPKDF